MFNIADAARFNGTVFMATAKYNALSTLERRCINGRYYVLHDGKWSKVGFTKPAKSQVVEKIAA